LGTHCTGLVDKDAIGKQKLFVERKQESTYVVPLCWVVGNPNQNRS
jgi:hypothetical protein